MVRCHFRRVSKEEHFNMTHIIAFLFLLTLVEANASSTNVTLSREKRDAVLIRSKRRWVLSTIDIEENMPGPFPAEVTQMFNDKETDYNIKFQIRGEGVDLDPKGLFTINENNGYLYVHRAVDREKKPVYHVDFDVLDRLTGEPVDRTLSFNVEIHDKNDNPPEFTPVSFSRELPENTKEGTLPVTLQAHDIDEKGTPNSQFTMRLVSQEPVLPKLTLQDITGTTTIKQLGLSGCFDYDKAKLYKVYIEAKDEGTPSLSSTATVFLNITDSNTHLPQFTAAKYNTEVMEMEYNKEILRIGVTDKDEPNTPASRAVFKILKGNEEGNYKIDTDPKTNEGVLYVIKGKNFEKTEITELEISVENEEKLFQCIDGKPVTNLIPKPNTAKVEVKVIDVNDPPEFKRTVEKVYRNENMDPGDVLFTPEVKDEDSDVNNIRYKLVQDPAKWVTVDPKTGKVTTVQKMDRESSYVKNNTYSVVIIALDDGEPQGTGTCTVQIHLGDVNDNVPVLLNKSGVLCVNKVDRVQIKAEDKDENPYAGPFSFSMMGDKELKELWKFDPTTGDSTSLITLKSLPYGNYSIPFKIQDQQALATEAVFHVVVCDCTEVAVCRVRRAAYSRLGAAAIGLLIAGFLLFFVLLLLCFLCEFGKHKNFQHIPLNLHDEGNQTLVKYNEEGGGSVYKPESAYNIKTAYAQPEYRDGYRNGTLRGSVGYISEFPDIANGGGVMSVPQRNMSMARTNTLRNGGSQMMQRTYSSRSGISGINLADQLDKKLYGFEEDQKDYPVYIAYEYDYEGRGSECESLDKLTVSNLGDNLDFLQNLGPKFIPLAGVCQEKMPQKSVRV
ncbi:cadherin-like protein 26 isoform X1 [Misgurnus anguillicaudatus]|uniref:cadherin-like protein 26 isoform X1 n=2 Tax=Misgurnus anguillicaudatus TaxID=75329 RepID=UPI003CCF3720